MATDHDFIQSKHKGTLQLEALNISVTVVYNCIIYSKVKFLCGFEDVKQLCAYPEIQINL
jgi:hypothetical protein